MRNTLRNFFSIFCLILVFGSYYGYYVNSQFTNENIYLSSLIEKLNVLNSLLSPKITGVETLKDFSSIKELVDFLMVDRSNELVYSSPNFVCYHFTETLIRNARAKGYRLEYLGLYGRELSTYQADYLSYERSLGLIGYWGEGDGHAVCVAFIGGRKIVIEPQTDVVFEELNGRFVGLYRGEY